MGSRPRRRRPIAVLGPRARSMQPGDTSAHAVTEPLTRKSSRPDGWGRPPRRFARNTAGMAYRFSCFSPVELMHVRRRSRSLVQTSIGEHVADHVHLIAECFELRE